MEVNRNSGDGPFVPSPEPLSGSATTTDLASSGTSPVPTSEPASPKPYWLKPTTMLWREWIAQGGAPAPWVKNDKLDYAY